MPLTNGINGDRLIISLIFLNLFTIQPSKLLWRHDKDRLETIKQHTAGLSVLKEELRYWDHDEVIAFGQAIRVSHRLVNAFIAEDNISYQYALGDNMEEATEAQQSECAVHFGIAYRE